MTPHRITIDMKKSGYKQFINIRQSENESHIIYISLTNGTEPIKLDNDMVATVYLEGISKQWESCDIKDNEIVFTAPILNVGDIKCQMQLSNNNGYSISPTFIIVVENILNVPHFELLEEEPDDWIDNADSYYTFNGIDYIPVKFNSDRNLLKNLEFHTNDHSAGSIVYKRSQAISVSQGRKIYCTTTSNMLSITLKFEYKIGDNLSGKITTKVVDCKAQMPIITPTITKRQYLENGYTDVVMSVVADSSYIDDNYKLTNTMLEYDEKTYINCNTPYFEKGKYYVMVNDYGNVGNSYNALIQALQEARTYYNKAIKEVSMIDNCIVITYNDNTQYKSGDLKGDGIARLDKSTDGNVDTYTFVTDKGNTFSFTVTNVDNTRIDDLYTQLGYKTPLAVFNNEVAYIKELIKNLDTKKESVEEHNKSISQLKNSLSIINTQISILNNNKVEKDTYTTAIESLQSLVTKLQNSKVDTNTYNDEIANLTTAISELNDKQIDTNAIKESITELDTKKLNKEEYNQYKENVANTFATTDNNIKTNKTSIESLKADFNSYKTSNDNEVNSKVDTTDFNTYKTATDKAVADNTKSIKANTTAIDKCATDIASNSALINQNSIKATTDKSTSIVLNDSSDCNIVNLTAYGNSTQSEVPTPTAPVSINDISGVNLYAYGKNLLDFDNTAFSKFRITDIVVDKVNKTISFTSNNDNLSGFFINNMFINKGLKGNITTSLVVTTDSECQVHFMASSLEQGLKTIKAGSTRLQVQGSIELGKDFWFYVKGQNHSITVSDIQIELGDTATEYEDFNNVQTIKISDVVLRSVDNVCDKIIINKNGDGYIERNIGVINLKNIPKVQWMKSGEKVDRYHAPLAISYNIQDYSKLLCTHFKKESNNDGEAIGKITSNSTNIGFAFAEKDTTTMEDWVSFINNNDVLLYYILSTPTVTQLTQEQVNNVLNIKTNYQNTTILSNCDFQLSYVADTKHYIDNKFNELATALVAHESEVN